MGAKSKVAGQLHRIKPEFGREIVAIDMYVGRLVGFMAVKVEPIGAGAERRRHGGIVSPTLKALAARISGARQVTLCFGHDIQGMTYFVPAVGASRNGVTAVASASDELML